MKEGRPRGQRAPFVICLCCISCCHFRILCNFRRYRNATQSPAAARSNGMHRRAPPTHRRTSRERSITRSAVAKRRSITPARDLSPVSGKLGTGDGPKERTIKPFSLTPKSKNGLATQLVAKPKTNVLHQDTQMSKGGDISLQSLGKPTSRASMQKLLGHYDDSDEE